ncbi:unnamed protein product [Mytilus coruscus]|uniref:PiggyBac transposable element-derived protein domain-containing protein n=1 Tax=Mytilus coruscus TaxID=42192 RepID=A0A6J8DWG0_MYTCO|nr:unnamed protein product [Mytilus coruscus]
MKLTESLDEGKDYNIFADNYFTSIKLAIALKDCRLLGEEKTMSLYTSISSLTSGLIEVKAKIGKPLTNTPPAYKKALAVKRPVDDVRKDGENHLHEWRETPEITPAIPPSVSEVQPAPQVEVGRKGHPTSGGAIGSTYLPGFLGGSGLPEHQEDGHSDKTPLLKRLLAKAEPLTEDIKEDKKENEKEDNKEDIVMIISDEETCGVKEENPEEPDNRTVGLVNPLDGSVVEPAVQTVGKTNDKVGGMQKTNHTVRSMIETDAQTEGNTNTMVMSVVEPAIRMTRETVNTVGNDNVNPEHESGETNFNCDEEALIESN